MPRSPLPLPRGWTNTVRTGVLHAIAIASAAMTSAWSKAASSRSSRTRALAEVDRLATEIALLKEELAIKDERFARVPARRRPHYGPVQRMRILRLKAARGWSKAQTADRFVMTEETVASWLRRLDENGEEGLVQVGEPVNKFPDVVAYMVRYLKVTCRALGKVRIAQVLARAGLHLGATTVGRVLKRDMTKDDVAVVEPDASTGRVVAAKSPNHVWHVDLTTVPTSAAFWVPWSPFSKVQRWPFAWWIAVVVDHASRLVVGFAVFKRRPNSAEVCSFLSLAMRRTGATPRYMISDQGKEFVNWRFKGWCSRKGIAPRYGAVGEHGSIAIVERFIRSMKSECARRIIVPFGMTKMRSELSSWATWYNECRPHQGIGGRTPLEVYQSTPAANEQPRFEPRAKWPAKSRCARPVVKIHGERGVRLELLVSRFENRPHLPVVELRRAS
jgi:transposase InsO family protein